MLGALMSLGVSFRGAMQAWRITNFVAGAVWWVLAHADLISVMAPLLLIASLCIVAGAGHGRRSSSSLRSASSPAQVMGAAPPHRFALHRRRRGSWAPLLLIASLCIVAGAVRIPSVRP